MEQDRPEITLDQNFPSDLEGPGTGELWAPLQCPLQDLGPLPLLGPWTP